MHLNYVDLEREVISALDKNRFWILSTSLHDKVTSRSISIINIGLDIYFQTSKSFEKYQQISQNKNVSLCFYNISIECIAEDIGTWKDTKNDKILELYKSVHPNSFENYGLFKNQVVIHIVPRKVTMWKYIDGKPYRDYLYIPEKKAIRELYDET